MGIIDFLGKIADKVQSKADMINDGTEIYSQKVYDEKRYIHEYTFSDLLAITKDYTNSSYRRSAAKEILKEKYGYEI